MKNLFIVPVLGLMLLSFQVKAQDNKAHAPCCPPSRNQMILTANTYQQTAKTVKFEITGITCAGCSSSIYNTLEQVNGVIDHSVEYPGDIAIIQFDTSKTNVEALKLVIEKKGYKVEDLKKKS